MKSGNSNRNSIWFYLACALAALFLCLPKPGTAQERQITLLIYLCGSDLETRGSAASRDVEEMLRSLPDIQAAQVLVMAGGSKVWHKQEVSAQETSIFRLSPEGLVKEHTLEALSMGDPQTLGMFLAYGYNHYPAQQYALLLWDHGAGPVVGVCFDERTEVQGGWDGLSLSELEQALASSPFSREPLSWIGFDACLMASLEVAQVVAPYAAYMIASQETEPVSGWNYDFLQDIALDEDGLHTGRRIADSYFNQEGKGLMPVTLSCIDLSQVAALAEATDQLFFSLGEGMTETAYQSYTQCRMDSKMVAGTSGFAFDLVDMKDYLEVLQAKGVPGCPQVLEALDRALVYNRSNTRFLNGLSLYSPFDNPVLYRDTGRHFLGSDTGYGVFTSKLTDFWLGKAIINWDDLASLQVQYKENSITVSLPLSQQQAQGLKRVKLRVLKMVDENAFAYLHTTQQYACGEDYILSLHYRNQALYMADQAGNRLTGPLTYFEQDGALLLHGILSKKYFESIEDIKAARLEYREDEEGSYQLARLGFQEANPVLQGKSTLQLGDWYELQLMHGVFTPAQDERGRMLPINKWPLRQDLISMDNLLLGDGNWAPQFLELEDTGGLYIMLEITDVQDHVICTELLPLRQGQ